MKALSELHVGPLPWYRAKDERGFDCVCDFDGDSVAYALISKRHAHLIAAAPEMAKVCYDLIMWDGCRDASICDIVAAAKAAYAKASGEEAK